MSKLNFKKLTLDDVEYLRNSYINRKNDNTTVEKLAVKLGNEYNVSERTIRKWFNKLKIKEKVDVEPEQYLKAKTKTFDLTKKRFIITWAQNNTPINKPLMSNIEAYAAYIKADIHVIAGRYRNPTSIWSESQKHEEFWSKEVLPYLDANRHDIHQFLSIMSDVKIQATAVNPMVGMQALSGVNSCVFGSPKVQMEMIPVLDGQMPKMMLTTGAVTQKNYTDTKSGKTGEFHHTFGFTIVEIKDDKTFFVRQVTADDITGEFSDLYFNVKDGEVVRIPSISAIILGDLHYGHHDQEVLKSTFKFMDIVNPKHVVLHDVFDGDSISHHAMKDPFIQYGKEVAGTNDLGKEIDSMLEGLKPFEKFKNVVIVRSNHDDFVDRWLKNEDWKKQPTFKNAPLYMELSTKLLKQYGKGGDNIIGVIPELINERFPNFLTLGRNASYKVKGFELGQHGDIGANGSRGSLLQMRKLNTKIVVGHYHCLPGDYQVQTKDNGWKEIKSICEGDEILSYDYLTNRNVWGNVNEFIENDYKGTMLQINGNGFEQTFTDKHMLMLSDGSYIPASEAICSRSASELPLTALPVENSGKSVDKIIIKQIVAIAADGSQDDYRIRFHLSKYRKIKRLKELFGEELIIYTDNENSFDGYISTRGKIFSDILSVKYNLKSVKNISVDILDWDSDSLEILIEELKFWDDTFDTNSNGRQYSTTNKIEASVISSALNRLGYSHTTTKREYDNINHKTLNIISWCSDRYFNRNSAKTNHSVRFNGWGFNSYQANVKVYCVSVPNKCFWVKSPKTGQVSLTGNSPGRKDGALAVGTTTNMRVGYNIGPSSWLQSHVIIHKDGRAQHLNFINGEFTNFKR